jgi:hypothetical protein
LVRRDAEMALEGLHTKGLFLEGLQKKISEHRRDDRAQLTSARQDAWKLWDERLARLEEWMASAGALNRSSKGVLAWRDTALWFDRAQDIAQRFTAVFEARIARMEAKLDGLTEGLRRWSERLAKKEGELREFLDRQTDKGAEILMSSARKRPHLDFVYLEREEEGRLAVELKGLSAGIRRGLERLARPETWIEQKANSNPAHFEIRRNQIIAAWRPLQPRLDAISEGALVQGLTFEEGRRRLRRLYEIVQRMRVIPDAPPHRRPFLHRLFNLQDE